MASGTIGGQPQSDDVNFAGTPPGLRRRAVLLPGPDARVHRSERRPAGAGQREPWAFAVAASAGGVPELSGPQGSRPVLRLRARQHGEGARAAILNAPSPTAQATIPPDVEITSPQWFEQVDPSRTSLAVDRRGLRAGSRVPLRHLRRPRALPEQRSDDRHAAGRLPEGLQRRLHGSPHTAAIDGMLGSIDLGALKSRFPPETQATGFTGREPGGGAQTSNGRPNHGPLRLCRQGGGDGRQP